MKKRNSLTIAQIKNLLKASRITRSSYALLSILAAASFMNIINIDIIILIIIGVMFYTIGGLQNSLNDNDHKINKKYFYAITFFIIIISLILALINKKIYIILPMVLALTFFYNTLSRKILFADVLTTSLTHMLIPFLGTLWILNNNISDYFIDSILPMSCYFFMINVKNLVGFKEDKKRGYITPMTIFKNGKTFMKISVIMGLIIILVYAYILKIYTNNLFIISLILISSIFLFKNIDKLEGQKSLDIARLILVFVLAGYLLENKAILAITLLFLLSSFIFVKKGLKVIINDLKNFKFHILL